MIGPRGARLAAAVAFLLTLLPVPPPARAETPEELFGRGNTAYEQGRFDDAAEAYRSVLRYRIRDPAVEYNLGNAELKLGHLGQAIVHYERARILDPTDPEVQANLEFAKSQCVDRVETPESAAIVRWIAAVQSRLGPDRQAWLALALVWAVGGLIAWCSARPGGWSAASGWTLAGLVVAFVLVGSSWYSTWTRLEGQKLAVVQEPAVEVLAGPGESNATLFTVHEGLTLEVRAERQEWVQVSLPNGLNGWIERKALELV